MSEEIKSHDIMFILVSSLRLIKRYKKGVIMTNSKRKNIENKYTVGNH